MRNGRMLKFVACGLLFGLIWATSALADNIYGRIRGVVTDPTGAMIPNAKLTAANLATGASWEVTTGTDGSFEFLQLPAPATYNVKANASGFKGFEVTGIDLHLDEIFVLNIQMEVGTVTQRVTVEASAAQVETTSMQLGKVLSGSQIVDMPLNGRNWITLQQTLPGVTESDRFGTNFATNGSRSQANDYLVNGVDAVDLPINTPQVVPSPDAIAEVSMVTNTINPEYGRNGGAILNATTKSGTNAYHGDGFEFYRDTSLNTRSFFAPKPTIFHQNQFGGTIGGPIKKDKSFFFFSFQGTRNRRPQAGGTSTVFTPDQRNGIFGAGAFDCAINTAKGQTVAKNCQTSPFAMIGDASSGCSSSAAPCPAGTPYGNVFDQTGAQVATGLFGTGAVPAQDFNPIAVNMMTKYVPLPNCGSNCNTFEFNPIRVSTDYQYLARVDHNISAKDSIFGYFLIEPSKRHDTLPFTAADLPGFPEQATARTQHYALNWTHTLSGNKVNEARFGYNRLNFHAVEPVNVIQPSSLGFTGIIPQDLKDAGVPKIDLSGGGLFTLGNSNNGPQPRVDQTYQVTDNFSWIKGHHTMKVGFQMLRSQVFNPFFFDNNGVFSFSGSGQFSTGLAGADFLLGIPDSYAQSSGGLINARTQTYYSYWQDQWKVRPNLTLTYGTGWQVDTPIKNLNNGGLSADCFRPAQQSAVFPTAPAGLIFPGDPTCNSAGGVTVRRAHFGPRIGFAYSPGSTRKWSIRGGYGIYYNRTEEELTLQNLTNAPFSLTDAGIGDAGGSPSFATPFTDVSGTFSIPNKYPFNPPQAGSGVDFSFFEPLILNIFDRNFSVPYSQNYNLTIERELPAATILTISYVGLSGRKLTNVYQINPAGTEAGNPVCLATPGCSSFTLANPPSRSGATQSFRYPQTNAAGLLIFGALDQQGTFVNSVYNSLQITAEKKTTHGLTFRATYAWSHSLDGSSSFEDLSFTGVRGLDPFNLRNNYGDSTFDARHRFVISYTYEIPSAGHLSAFSKLPSRLTDGWRFTGISTLQRGLPVTIGSTNFRSFTCDVFFEDFSCWDRPNTLGPVATVDPRTSSFNNSLHGTRPPRGVQDHYWFDPNAFGREALGTLGNAGRNFFHGPGINNFDFALMKDTRITETTRIELRFEFFNIINHTNFNSIPGSSGFVSGNAGSRNFGRILSANNPIDSRIIQLAAKFYF
jgi:carboxypeptidase family protein